MSQNLPLMFPLKLHTWFEIGALLVCLLFYRNIRQTSLKWLLPFMLFIVAVELSARYAYTEMKRRDINQMIFNVSVPVEYMFYAFIFSLHYRTRNYRRVARVFLGILAVLVLFNISLDYLIEKISMETFVVFGSIIFKLICVLYTCISIAVLCSGKKIQKV
jgi:hypothetical protein